MAPHMAPTDTPAWWWKSSLSYDDTTPVGPLLTSGWVWKWNTPLVVSIGMKDPCLYLTFSHTTWAEPLGCSLELCRSGRLGSAWPPRYLARVEELSGYCLNVFYLTRLLFSSSFCCLGFFVLFFCPFSLVLWDCQLFQLWVWDLRGRRKPKELNIMLVFGSLVPSLVCPFIMPFYVHFIYNI